MFNETYFLLLGPFQTLINRILHVARDYKQVLTKIHAYVSQYRNARPPLP